MTRTIKASEFKATCLKLMDEVNETGEPITITKNGAPIARLMPMQDGRRSLWGLHEGLIRSHGDLDEPVIDPDAWEANR